MSGMDHAAAHEQIEDLILEPARMRALETSTAPDDVALLDHVAGCSACRADLEGWADVRRRLAGALPNTAESARSAVEPIDLPPSLRTRVITAVRGSAPTADLDPVTNEGGRLRFRGRLGAWAALAASIVVIVGATAITLGQLSQRATAEANARDLAAAIAVVDRMLATEHKVVELQTASGIPAGTISWSRHDWVVLTSALVEPARDQEYLCWLETAGRSVLIGRMEFAGATAYWVASLDEWQTWEIDSTTRFIVTLEPRGASRPSGAPILEARLRS